MALNNVSSGAERRANYRKCACPFISGDTWIYDPEARISRGRIGKSSQAVIEQGQQLLKQPENHLRNLKETYESLLESNRGFWYIEDIRDYFLKTKQIPFRNYGCPRATLTCCGSCSRKCDCRCPQDVLQRAYMKIAPLIYAPNEEVLRERLKDVPLGIRYLYEEWVSPEPSYLRIQAQVTELIDPKQNKQLRKIIEEEYHNEDTPERQDYAPTIEYEYDERTQTSKKKVDPVTGVVAYLEWPLSGLCPFCLPAGLTDNRRRTGVKRGPYNKTKEEYR